MCDVLNLHIIKSQFSENTRGYLCHTMNHIATYTTKYILQQVSLADLIYKIPRARNIAMNRLLLQADRNGYISMCIYTRVNWAKFSNKFAAVLGCEIMICLIHQYLCVF